MSKKVSLSELVEAVTEEMKERERMAIAVLSECEAAPEVSAPPSPVGQ